MPDYAAADSLMSTHHAFALLDDPPPSLPRVCVAFGGERFLKRMVIDCLRGIALGSDGDEQAPYATFSGKTAEWRDVVDELTTISLFGDGARLVVLDEADAFVTEHRGRLEDLGSGELGGFLGEVGVTDGRLRSREALEK